MKRDYIKTLLKLSERLEVQLAAEREDDLMNVPILLADQIKYLCGYIEALKEIKHE